MADANGCVKAGPYLPVGDIDWQCRTHKIELVPISGPNEQGDYRKSDLVCPIGEPEKVVD